MRVALFTLADDASPGEEGKLTLHGAGISHVRGAELPVRMPNVAVVARLLIDDDDQGPHEIRIRWLGPDSGVVAETPPAQAEIRLPSLMHEGEEAALNVVMRIENLTLAAFGRFQLQFLWDGEVAAEQPLAVIRTPKPGPE